MEEERRQRELFEFEKPRKRFGGLSGIFRRSGLDGSTFAVTLKTDKIVFLSIAVIMLMVVVYALGVERGRTAPPKRTREPKQAAAQLPAALKTRIEVKPQFQAEARLQAAAPAAVVVKDASKPYTIAVASLSKKENALAEASRMRSKGFDSYVIYVDPYYVVCVGAFTDKTSAASEKELLKVRRFCRDAYFKQR